MVSLPGVTIRDKIYESASSLVYRGVKEQDGSPIILKVLKHDYPTPAELTRYRQEYEVTRSLNLEGVIKVYSQQDYQRTLVMILEDFGGESLEKWMQDSPQVYRPIALPAFLRLAVKITEILGSIHAANIIHKDINPSNIVLNPGTGQIKIIDFGIATRFSRTNPTFKSLHVLEGTFAYLSPEQTGRMNRWLDYRTDFYSLGVTFYELLAGYLPFPTADILELVHCHIAKQPVPLCEMNAAIPKAVSDIVLKLMAKKAEDRYQSAWGIKADLEICLRQFIETEQIGSIQLGLQDVSDQFHIPQKLYGREAEIAALLTAFERVAGTGNEELGVQNKDTSHFKVEMMLVSGYSGVGKSALVQELYKPIAAKRGYFISGKFDQFQRNIPYCAIAHALQKLVQQLLGEPDEQLQQWRSHLLTALGSNGQLIIDVIPEVELIVGKQMPVPSVGATEAQNRFNRVFQQFIRVFCSKENPLVIFLDDLQWIDSATLKLIELMLLDEQTQFLFLIGAYRDNEVTPTHPLASSLEDLRKKGAMLQEIVLAPLTLEPLSQLIAEPLHHDADAVSSLAQLVLRKTGGNPFFVSEFLRMLYSENLLTFDVQHLSWQWNIAQIQAQNTTNNVVELMLLKLRKLPQSTQQILCLAACIGAEFNLDTLSLICDKSPKTVSLDLLAAIQAGLIQPLSELDENLLVQEYKFLHDRVQQAAYALLNKSQKQVVHLQIGRNLLEKSSLERLFEILEHFNHGLELVMDQPERDKIARLNLLAGQKAKRAIAYSVANQYLATARAWLAASSWQTNYELTLELYTETTEVTYLCGEFEQVEYWVAIVLQEARTFLDSIKVHEIEIQAIIAQNQLLKAIETGLQVLQQLGIGFPKQPSQSDIYLELDTIAARFREKPILELIHLTEMTEPEKLAAMRILASITIAARVAAPNLMPLLVSKQINLSIKYGNASVSSFAYASFGLILCGMGGNIESGYQFGQLALRLLSQANSYSLKARTLVIVHFGCTHWKEHIRESLEPLREGYQSGLETGDLEFAANCTHAYCCHSFFIGKTLVELEREMTSYNEAVRQIKQKTALIWTQIYHQSVLKLMGYSINSTCLTGKSYTEENRPPLCEIDGVTIFLIHLNKLFLCYLFSEYAQAVENSIVAESHLIQAIGGSSEPFYYFYDSLAGLATYSRSSAQIQKQVLNKVTINQEKMKQWAHHAPMNYLHKYHLVEAEKARVLGQVVAAMDFYELAIKEAKDNEYTQEEALGYELAAKFYLARGMEKFAQTYMKEAHYCYERWGATAKVKDLETRYPQFFPPSSSVNSTTIRTISESSFSRSDIVFDLATVVKASQAISSEIELEQLLRSLMQILIENAGAQTGCLILENSGEWEIAATCEVNEDEKACDTQVLRSVPMANRLPESIIQYVVRTHESVILNDATREGNFTNDPYIQHHQTQSLLCLPLLNQNKLVGVLYLENQLAVGAFTPERSHVLHLLSTQAAIAIENARLYSRLREGESRMTQFLEAIPVGLVVVDTAGRPYYFNQRATQLLGKEINPSLPPDRLAEVYQIYLAGTDQTYPTERMPIIQALSGERTTVDDMEIHQNSAIIPVEVWGTPIFDEQGNVAYALAAFQDITERRQAEQLLADYNRTLEQQVAERTAALQQREAELRALFAAVPDPLFVLTVEGRVIEAVEVGADQLHKPIEEQVGKTLHESFPQEQADEFLAYIHQVLSTQQVLTVEYSLPMAGQTTWFSTRIAPIRTNQVIWLARDITQRKQAEEALQRSEAKFRNIFENSQVGIFQTRLSDGLILDANQRLVELFGFDSPDEIIGIKRTTDFYVNPVELHPHLSELQIFDKHVRNIEVQIRKQNGTLFWGLYSFRLNTADGYMECVITDISDRKRAEAASILEERNHMAREIHDTLAQAFTGIIIHTRSASDEVTADPEKAQTLLTQILDLARSGLAEARRSVEALRRPYLLENNNLQDALSRLAAQLDSSIATQIVYEVMGTTYPLSCDLENNLFRIGQEAVTNAIKHAKANEIRIELLYEPTQCSLRIQDDGQGFEVENQAMRNGFGLIGMAERAERIGAELQIQSHLGQGTEIVISIDRE